MRPIHLDHFVPAGTPPLREVIHYGRNSLPALHILSRSDSACQTLVVMSSWGYNEHALRVLTGRDISSSVSRAMRTRLRW